MDIEDVRAALKEIRRILRPLGSLVISIVHPFADRGRFAGPEADARFVLQKYFGRERAAETIYIDDRTTSRPSAPTVLLISPNQLSCTFITSPVPIRLLASIPMKHVVDYRLPWCSAQRLVVAAITHQITMHFAVYTQSLKSDGS